MNILITGGTGFVGSHMIDFILKYAIKPNQKIYCTKRWMEDTKNLDHIDDKRLEYIDCDSGLTCNSSIMEIVDKSKTNGVIYNISGQAIRERQGLYIENGKIYYKTK